MSNITGREPRLLTTSNDTRRGYRRLSLRHLGTLINVLPPDAISLDAAAAMLHSDDFYVRHNAARLLSGRGDRAARLVMQAALKDGNGPTRASVARHLHRFSWYAGEPLLRQALADEDERVREGAAYALCDLRELAAYQVLVDVLPGETDTVRSAAVWGLRHCQDSAAVPVLEAAMQARDPDVRIKALETLSANNTPEAIPVVEKALREDGDLEVVYNAVLSLIELRGIDCLSALADSMTQTSGERLEPLLRGLFHATNYLHVEIAGHPSVDALLAALAHALADNSPTARMAAVWVLAWMRDERADALLRDAFYREQSGVVQAHLLRVAVSLMTTVGAEFLQAGLQSADETVREQAGQLQAVALATYDEDDAASRPLSRAELALQSPR
jgi:bilin biosynthesis protein